MSEKIEKSEMARILIHLRKSNGLTQENVANYLKIKRSTYAYYERNVSPPYDIIKKLSAMYNVPAYQLIYGTPDPVEREISLVTKQSAERVSAFRDDTFFGVNSPSLTSYPTLTENEKKLVANYRLLTPKLREKVLKEIEDLCEKLD